MAHLVSLAVVVASCSASAFAFTSPAFRPSRCHHASSALQGYLDDLSSELYAPDNSGEELNREASNLEKEKIDRYGVGSWDQFVDFEEFDGGDGQMGVAGDGNKGLDKEWEGEASMAKSRVMSAKNAWGRSTSCDFVV